MFLYRLNKYSVHEDVLAYYSFRPTRPRAISRIEIIIIRLKKTFKALSCSYEY